VIAAIYRTSGSAKRQSGILLQAGLAPGAPSQADLPSEADAIALKDRRHVQKVTNRMWFNDNPVAQYERNACPYLSQAGRFACDAYKFTVAAMKPFFLPISRSHVFCAMLVFCGCLTAAVAETGRELGVESAGEYGSLREGSLRKSWKKLPPEEREELRRQMRDAWQRLSKEEQERLLPNCWEKDDKGQNGRPGGLRDGKSGKEKDWKEGRCSHKRYREHWHSLSPEEREVLRSKLREALRQKETPPGDEITPESMPVNQPGEATAQ